MKFRKKPVVIEATQWFKNGDHPLDYSRTHDGLENGELRQFSPEERKSNDWEGDIVRYFRSPEKAYSGERHCEHCGEIMHKHGWIDTLEGGHIVCPGDWIITGVKGEHYPCKPDIFEATYDLVSEPEQPCTHKWGVEFSTHNHEPARMVCVKCGYRPNTSALNVGSDPVKVPNDAAIEALAKQYDCHTSPGFKGFARALLAKYSERDL